MSAPVSTSRVTVSVLPDRAASISGVAPVAVGAIGVGAGGDQRRHHLRVPGLAGHVQRVMPPSRVVARTLAPADSSICASAASPLVAAQCSAVMPSPCAALTSAPCFSSALHRGRIARLRGIGHVGARRRLQTGDEQIASNRRNSDPQWIRSLASASTSAIVTTAPTLRSIAFVLSPNCGMSTPIPCSAASIALAIGVPSSALR